jgi:hypothetical protein
MDTILRFRSVLAINLFYSYSPRELKFEIVTRSTRLVDYGGGPFERHSDYTFRGYVNFGDGEIVFETEDGFKIWDHQISIYDGFTARVDKFEEIIRNVKSETWEDLRYQMFPVI